MPNVYVTEGKFATNLAVRTRPVSAQISLEQRTNSALHHSLTYESVKRAFRWRLPTWVNCDNYFQLDNARHRQRCDITSQICRQQGRLVLKHFSACFCVLFAVETPGLARLLCFVHCLQPWLRQTLKTPRRQ